MRITYNQVFEEGLRDISRTAVDLDVAQRRVSSGRIVERPSDDPTGTAASVTERAAIATVDAYQRATDAASSRLAVADAVLSDIINQVTAAKVATTAAEGSGRTQAQRDAYSAEILSIRDAILGDINTRFASTYLFAGASSTTAPYTGSGGTFSSYQGDSSPLSLDVAKGRAAQISFDGGAILQGSDSVHLLDTLTALATAVNTGDAAGMQQGMDALDRAFDRAVSAQSLVGGAQRTLDDVKPQLAAARVGSQTRVSKIEDADMATAISELSRAQTAYKAALGAFSTRGQLSLLDFLK